MDECKNTGGLGMAEMLEIQRRLHDAHPEWGGLTTEQGVRQLLWMVGEIGEVIDVVKKAPEERYMSPGKVREHFVEEFCDVLMYFVDALICYGVTAEEFSAEYRKKADYDLIRDYVSQNEAVYGEKSPKNQESREITG